MISLFNENSHACSRTTTIHYSSSFSRAIRFIHKDFRQAIYDIYGFVRFADEIVDTFHDTDQSVLLNEFKAATASAIDRGISLNPILHSFQITVNRYEISHDLIDSFFRSMEYDLHKKSYDRAGYEEYIYGSAEVVGLMCLTVFCGDEKGLYTNLKPYAQSLGAAFQKVNFLRDISSDYAQLNRTYFPGLDFTSFSCHVKKEIENDIDKDFTNAYQGIVRLPLKTRFGVYLAYKYYMSLFQKIRKTQPERIMEKRIRISGYSKVWLTAKAVLGMKLHFR